MSPGVSNTETGPSNSDHQSLKNGSLKKSSLTLTVATYVPGLLISLMSICFYTKSLSRVTFHPEILSLTELQHQSHSKINVRRMILSFPPLSDIPYKWSEVTTSQSEGVGGEGGPMRKEDRVTRRKELPVNFLVTKM